ncbi:hypothetical protein GF312_02260 [Candidatus Poribacteria bacterium]|nr:hypothetical protein [Candidatus Poribacteria bacterium]
MNRSIMQAKLRRVNEKLADLHDRENQIRNDIETLDNETNNVNGKRIASLSELYQELQDLAVSQDSLDIQRQHLQEQLDEIKQSEFIREHNAATIRLYEKARRYNHLAAQVMALRHEIEQDAKLWIRRCLES